MPTIVTRTIHPADRGRLMRLADCKSAEWQEGYRCDLGRGIIVVSEIPLPSHIIQICTIDRQGYACDARSPGVINGILGSGECKLVIDGYESQRHPDLALYPTPPPRDRRSTWRVWVPDIVSEVVSLDSAVRDYHKKCAEYLACSVREYWMFDARREEMLVPRRAHGRCKENTLQPGEVDTTHLLPDLPFAIAPVFEATTKSDH